MKTKTIVELHGIGATEVEAFIPFEGCPLGATRAFLWSFDGKPNFGKEWRVTHLATGMLAGQRYFKTRKAAFAFIEAMSPRDPVWVCGKDQPTIEKAYELYKAACAQIPA